MLIQIFELDLPSMMLGGEIKMKNERVMDYIRKFILLTRWSPPEPELIILVLSEGLYLCPFLVPSYLHHPTKSSRWTPVVEKNQTHVDQVLRSNMSSDLTFVLTDCTDLYPGTRGSTSGDLTNALLQTGLRQNGGPWQGVQKTKSRYYCFKWLYLFSFYS